MSNTVSNDSNFDDISYILTFHTTFPNSANLFKILVVQVVKLIIHDMYFMVDIHDHPKKKPLETIYHLMEIEIPIQFVEDFAIR